MGDLLPGIPGGRGWWELTKAPCPSLCLPEGVGWAQVGGVRDQGPLPKPSLFQAGWEYGGRWKRHLCRVSGPGQVRVGRDAAVRGRASAPRGYRAHRAKLALFQMGRGRLQPHLLPLSRCLLAPTAHFLGDGQKQGSPAPARGRVLDQAGVGRAGLPEGPTSSLPDGRVAAGAAAPNAKLSGQRKLPAQGLRRRVGSRPLEPP